MESVISRIEQGNGALDFLTTDSSFVRTLDSTMTNLQKGSLLLNQDLEALQHSFLFRRYFKKKSRQKP
jgi:phospholipid/cholesterol/gamma-HCH transport system substrate-binding protein